MTNEVRKRGRPPGQTPRRAALFINCTETERATIAEAVETHFDGLVPISTWARDVLVKEANKLLKRKA
jgi:hypothetical protein